MYAKVRLTAATFDPAIRDDGLPPRPAARSAENTVAAFVGLEEVPPRPWPDNVLADPELALGDACPAMLRGFGWWRAGDESVPLGIRETYDQAIVTLDPTTRTAMVTRAVIPASEDDIAGYFADLETALHLQIKQDARQAILAYAPDWKQRNALARSAELLETLITVGALTEDEEVERQSLHAMRERINVYRRASNDAEAAVTAARGDENAMRAAAAIDWSAVE
jgi:hypothetical protein